MHRVAEYRDALGRLLAGYRLAMQLVPDGATIPGSYWGAPEAGLADGRLYVRADTPLHSALHEAAHYVCMTAARRAALDTDAGGDDAEECAVCYLQVRLGAEIDGSLATDLMKDMDTWGYSFRLGSTEAWLRHDAADARGLLVRWGLIGSNGRPTYRLRD